VSGQKVVEEVRELIDRKPVQVTECLLIPESYLKKFGSKRKRR